MFSPECPLATCPHYATSLAFNLRRRPPPTHGQGNILNLYVPLHIFYHLSERFSPSSAICHHGGHPPPLRPALTIAAISHHYNQLSPPWPMLLRSPLWPACNTCTISPHLNHTTFSIWQHCTPPLPLLPKTTSHHGRLQRPDTVHARRVDTTFRRPSRVGGSCQRLQE